ncbi:hypothetical protein MKZ38_006519 [Zalerion maritima]|uniref:BHLH domain-containing protein n=1 Tax=Zalerion maritima TaxID=339359 RepID=A0AAD5WY63_9PEZI|nr:hypothetical protein MKZ38_006519 [Zalerion maritima]
MADPVPQPEQEITSPGTPGQKRKRSSEQGSPDSRRSKRGAPAAAMSTGENMANNYLDSTEIANAAAAASVNVADFSALHAAAHGADHHEQPEAADPANASSTAAAALDYPNIPNIHIPQTTEETFVPPPSLDEHHETSFTAADLGHTPDGLLPTHAAPSIASSVPSSVPIMAPSSMPTAMPSMPQVPAIPSPVSGVPQNGYARTPTQGGPRPAVGSEEWHKIRKDNHKEVERRRRETINEGINELSKIVPGCEKNKGSILQRAVSFITQLKENEAQNIEKWTLEKLLTEQAIAELSASNDKLKQECDRLYRDVESWKRLCQENGISGPKEEPATTTSAAASTPAATTAPATTSS